MTSTFKSWQSQLVLGSAAAITVVTIAGGVRRWQWRTKRRSAGAEAPAVSDDADILRVGFAMKKLPSQIDHIVIGSGLSGLYTAALLAKLGRRVVVLEQHYVAGGCTHTFKDKGFEFDTGVHYMGMATQFTAFMDFAAGREGAFRMERQGSDDGSEIYNEFHASDYVHQFRPGPTTFVNDLVAKFPQEESAIRRFFFQAQIASSAMGLVVAKQFLPQAIWNIILSVPSPLRWFTRRYIKRTLSEALTDCGVKDGMLRATIGAEFGDYGVVPDEAPFFLHAGILNHYLPEGGFSPVGGSDAFAAALVPTIVQAGGAVLVRAPVDQIIVEGGRAVGVELKGGKTVRAIQSVISAAGVEVTYRKLLNEVDVAKNGGPPVSLMESEKGEKAQHVYGFFGFKGTKDELKLPTYNIWSIPPVPGLDPSDLSGIWQRLFAPKGQEPDFLANEEACSKAQIPAFISFPSAKDSNYDQRCPGLSTAVVLSESYVDYFGEPGPENKRNREYGVIKKRYEQLLRNALFRHFPHLEGLVEYVDIATPASNEHYLGRKASYGLNQNSARFLDPTLRVTVPGVSRLYITGQDVLCGGVFPQVFSAWISLAKVLGVTSFDFWLLFADFAGTVLRRSCFDKTYASKNP